MASRLMRKRSSARFLWAGQLRYDRGARKDHDGMGRRSVLYQPRKPETAGCNLPFRGGNLHLVHRTTNPLVAIFQPLTSHFGERVLFHKEKRFCDCPPENRSSPNV